MNGTGNVPTTLTSVGHVMNAVEIEEAVSRLAEAPFDPEDFPDASEMKTGSNKPVKRKTKGADA